MSNSYRWFSDFLRTNMCDFLYNMTVGKRVFVTDHISGPLLHAKFHPHRCNVSPLRGEKPQNRPLSKLNTGRFALRAMLPVMKTFTSYYVLTVVMYIVDIVQHAVFQAERISMAVQWGMPLYFAAVVSFLLLLLAFSQRSKFGCLPYFHT